MKLQRSTWRESLVMGDAFTVYDKNLGTECSAGRTYGVTARLQDFFKEATVIVESSEGTPRRFGWVLRQSVSQSTTTQSTFSTRQIVERREFSTTQRGIAVSISQYRTPGERPPSWALHYGVHCTVSGHNTTHWGIASF